MKKTTIIICLALGLALGSGCKVSIGQADDPLASTPQAMARQGMEEIQARRYPDAVETFRQLKDRHPYSKYALLAELKMADALYLDKLYLEAQEAYQEFERLHPKNEAVPYVVFQQGMCHFKRIKSQDRDITDARLAIQTFNRLATLFPGSEYTVQAQARVLEAQDILAGHELTVAEFYFKRGEYLAALGRFESLVASFPDTGHHARALAYIQVCRDELNRSQEAQEARAAKKAAPQAPPDRTDGPRKVEK